MDKRIKNIIELLVISLEENPDIVFNYGSKCYFYHPHHKIGNYMTRSVFASLLSPNKDYWLLLCEKKIFINFSWINDIGKNMELRFQKDVFDELYDFIIENINFVYDKNFERNDLQTVSHADMNNYVTNKKNIKRIIR